MRRDDALPEVAPGDPEFDHALDRGDGRSPERPSTSHISIVDRYGNALSMTASIENGFGSRLMVRGFLLNNQLTDFSFSSHENGRPIANAVAPGKRPRSSMAPTILRRDGQPVLVLGSPGGSRIIGYVAKTIIAWADWDMDPQQAVSLPHLINRFGPYDLEPGADGLVDELRGLGYHVSVTAQTSGLHVIEIGQGLTGGADPRREGLAYGQ
jgi:gamma-glutamyltranspeptidase/glutathione hydrolase